MLRPFVIWLAISVLPGLVLAGDPTSPSPKLIAKIHAETHSSPSREASSIVENIAADPIQLKLLGLMLRDGDNGTAIVSLNGAQVRVIRLRRNQLANQPLVEFDDETFVLFGFTHQDLVLTNRDGSREFTLK